MPRSAALALVLVLGLLGRGVSAEDPERSLLARIAGEDETGRAEALAAWKDLSDLERTSQARAGLRSTDPAEAFAAALAVSPWSCDLEELGLRSRAMERDPIAWFDPPRHLKELGSGESLGFGAQDLPAIWKALGARDPDPKRIGYSRTHRVMLPEQVPELVPLLETAGPRAFRALLWDLVNMADSVAGDEHHAEYVRAFRYGLARARAEAAKKPRPKLADVPPPEPRAGLPAEFIELARATWAQDGKGFELTDLPEDDEVPGRGPWPWLHRWAPRLSPAEDDATFLVDLIEWASPEQTKGWAGRAIASLEGRAGGHALARVLSSRKGGQTEAAAERARRGDRKAWDELAAADKVGELLWLVDPQAARKAAWKEMREGGKPGELTTEERWFLAYVQGIDIVEEHLDWLGARIEAEGASPPVEAWFVTACHPSWLTRARAELLAKRWAGQPDAVSALEQPVRRALAAMDLWAPEATRALLRRWAREAKDEDGRSDALVLLARVGDEALVENMLAGWPDSWHRSPELLGRVRTPQVEALLRREAQSEDPERESKAVEALARLYGCPDSLAPSVGRSARDDKAVSEERWATMKVLVLAKDPIGAVLLRMQEGPSDGDVSALGLVRDPRVLERLALWRERRDFELYWTATGCLALQGDEAARREWRAFLEQARTFLLDSLQDPRSFTLNGDPEWVAYWVSRLDANCCYGWHAQAVLKGTFPTFPFEHAAGSAGRQRRGAERWFERHKGTFVWSPILDGWIPGPRR